MNIALKNFWLKLDTVLKFAVIAGLFCLVFLMAHRALFDLDIWLHLKAGEYIVKTRAVPTSDIFSFTMQGKPWVDHEWLFQALVYLIYNSGQIDSLLFLESLVIVLAFLVLFLIGYRQLDSYLEPAILTSIMAHASIVRFNIRPDIFSLFFFALYLYILRFELETKKIWWLLPVQALWVNIHGYFFLGPLLVLLFIIAESIRRGVRFLPWQWKEESALGDGAYARLKKIFFLTVLACLLNPAAAKGALYPYYIFTEMLQGKVQIFFKYIQELQPTLEKVNAIGNPYYVILVGCLAVMVINLRRLKIIEPILFALFFFFSLKIRNVAFFYFVVYTIIIAYLAPTIKAIGGVIRIRSPLLGRRNYFLLHYLIAAWFFFWLAQKIEKTLDRAYYELASHQTKSYLTGIESNRFPQKAADFVLENGIPSNMFNDFNSGAYLIGRAYPKRKVFIDGRTELYGPDFFSRYADILDGDVAGFNQAVDKYKIGAAFFNMDAVRVRKIITVIYKNPQWKLVFFDDISAVFLKDIPSNQATIKKFKVDFSKYAVPAEDLKTVGLRKVYPRANIQRAYLFNILEEDGPLVLECKEALRIMPNCAEAFHLLGKAYLRKSLYKEALESLRSANILYGGNIDMLVDLGICLKQMKEPRLAINALKGAIKIDKRNAPAHYELGVLYLDLQDAAKAVRELKQAIKYSAKEPGYYSKLAEALYNKGKRFNDKVSLARAKEALAKAVALEARYQDSLLHKELEGQLKKIGQ
jgi:tetratricopeptide (TPR) repeat protein